MNGRTAPVSDTMLLARLYVTMLTVHYAAPELADGFVPCAEFSQDVLGLVALNLIDVISKCREVKLTSAFGVHIQRSSIGNLLGFL